MKKIIVIFAVLFLVSIGLCTIAVKWFRAAVKECGKYGKFQLASPRSNEFIVFTLPFKGSKPHPLDDTLRLFCTKEGLTADRYQTRIPVSRVTGISWLSPQTSLCFAILVEKKTAMVWRIEGDEMLCVEGSALLTDDPYLEYWRKVRAASTNR